MFQSTFKAIVVTLALAANSVSAQPLPTAIPLPPTATELQLTAAQTAQWQSIQNDAREFRQSLLFELATGLPALEADLAASDADLAVITQRVQSQVLYALWRSQPIRQRRMAFYQSLNPEQQAAVRAWLADVTASLQRAVAAAQVLSGH